MEEIPVLLAESLTMVPEIEFAVGWASRFHSWANPNLIIFPEQNCKESTKNKGGPSTFIPANLSLLICGSFLRGSMLFAV